MEANNMQNEKKEFIKKFNVVIEDLLDNYEKYSDEEKAQIKELFEKVADLNKILDKYDVESEVNWSEYWGTVSQYFVTVRYF
jgi:predicted methyltransferase